MVPHILCALPEPTFRRMFSPALEADLRALGDVVFCPAPRELSEDAYGALWEAADAVVTGWGVRPPSPETLDRATRLQIISHTAGSVRWLPRRALENGIVVTTAQSGIARTVAEYCLATTLLLLRRRFGNGVAETLYGKTVGLVGFGHVARLFRDLLAPFDVRVLVYDPFLSDEDAARLGVEQFPLPDLLQTSKVVSLHAPDIPSTEGMIGARELAMIPDGAVFVNSARGRLVDTDALTAALATGRFSAALDVTEPEPLPPGHPLRALPNVLLTPHQAGPTEDDLPRMTRMALDDLARFLRGEAPIHVVSLDVYDRMSF